MADMVHLYCEATGQHSWQPARAVGAWTSRGWEPVQEDEDSAAEADTTAEHHSRGKTTAKTTKDK